MKKFLFATTIMSLLLITTAFAPPAVVTKDHFEFDEMGTIVNTCNGENIEYSLHAIQDIHSVINGNRDNLHLKLKAKIDGIGDQGNTYHGFVNASVNENTSLTNGSYIYNVVQNIRIVSKGNAPNMTVQFNFKITITPNGDISVENENIKANCFDI